MTNEACGPRGFDAGKKIWVANSTPSSIPTGAALCSLRPSRQRAGRWRSGPVAGRLAPPVPLIEKVFSDALPPALQSRLQPIENAFAKLKALPRKAAERSIGGLWDTIGRIIDLFPPSMHSAIEIRGERKALDLSIKQPEASGRCPAGPRSSRHGATAFPAIRPISGHG